jgi:hypothetical protein
MAWRRATDWWRGPSKFVPPWPTILFDEHCLLLPNLFDEAISQPTQSDPQVFRELFALLGAHIVGEEHDHLQTIVESLAASPETILLLTSNFSESAKMNRDKELAAYRDFIGEHGSRRATLILKPHPRDSVQKVSQLREMLAQSFGRVHLLANPAVFYLPFEVIVARYFAPYLAGGFPMKVIGFSTACLSLDYLYGVPCVVGFGDKISSTSFEPQWVEGRLGHERDLRQALHTIRRRRTSEPTPTLAR